MRGLLFIILSFGITILAWGLYGPFLHVGQAAMSETDAMARMRPFVCVGIAYFAIGVVVPIVLLYTKGEKGSWTSRGTIMSLFAGALGAIGALGIILSFEFGGRPSFVMPLVFGGAPVVNAFLTIYWAKRVKEIGPVFLAGLIMVLIGASIVLVFRPAPPKHDHEVAQNEEVAEEDSSVSLEDETSDEESAEKRSLVGSMFFLLFSIVTTIICWGAYGPVLHNGQAAMQHSRLRPLLCVGLAYFAIAVMVPNMLLVLPGFAEESSYNFWGTTWSLAAGAAGAIGALGIIMAFNFGGKPIYVMPLVFGGAPVVNTFATVIKNGQLSSLSPFFLAGLILVIAGAVLVLIFAPKGAPPKTAAVETKESKEQPAEEQKVEESNEQDSSKLD